MVTGPVQQPSLVARPRVAHPAGLPPTHTPSVYPASRARPASPVTCTPSAGPSPSPPPGRAGAKTFSFGCVRCARASPSTSGSPKAPAGLYRELLTQSPRLDHGVRLLTREHAAIVAAILAVQQIAERSEAHPDELRHRAGHLLRRLARHRRRGADLLWEAYQTDLGGET